MTGYDINYFARFRPLKNGSFPDDPPLASLLNNTVSWREETMEAPVLVSRLPEYRFKLWYPPAPLKQLSLAGGLQNAILCRKKSERAAGSFSVMFKGFIPFLLHFITDAEGRKHHPFKITILYFGAITLSHAIMIFYLYRYYTRLSCYIYVHS